MTKMKIFFGILIFIMICIALGNTGIFSGNNKFLKEGLQNLANPGEYPYSTEYPLLEGSYPYTGSKTVSNKDYNDIWMKYPVFRVGSYEQITNNLRYWSNPDDGECVRADMCDALYKDKEVLSNVIQPLGPVPETMSGVRVNYYNTDQNLFLGPQAGPELPVFA